jgi:SsrA-binding protein
MELRVSIKNKKALFNYELVETLVAGMVLTGTEIKSIREGKVSLNDAYCLFQKGEMWVKSVFIAEYTMGNIFNHETRRARKLLVNRREINKWNSKVKEKGLTMIPVRLFINEKGIAKLEIALARGKKKHDKRETMKQRDVKRELDRVKKRF